MKLTPEQVEKLEAALAGVCHMSSTRTPSGLGIRRCFNLDTDDMKVADLIHPDTILTLCREWTERGEALEKIRDAGRNGMEPDYSAWLTFHDKIAEIAEAALKGADHD